MSRSRLSDEIEVLRSIYGDDHISYDGSALLYANDSYMLTIDIPLGYPDVAVSTSDVEFHQTSIGQVEITALKAEAEQLCLNSAGEEVLYQLIELYRSKLDDLVSNSHEESAVSGADAEAGDEDEHETTCSSINPDNHVISSHLNIIHGEILMERKSSFQAHLALVRSMEDVKEFRDIVLRDKKVSHCCYLVLCLHNDDVSYIGS
jgi:hypothetical protein